VSPAKKSFFKKFIISILLIFIIGGGIAVFVGYRLIYQPNVKLSGKKTEIIFVRTGSTYEDVLNTLLEEHIIVNRASFERLAELKGYKSKVKAGRYRVRNNMNNNELINMLRAGIQEPVKITFNNIRTKDELVSRVCKKIEADSMQMLELLNNDGFLDKYDLTADNALCMFLPNTYEVYWNTQSDEFLDRMANEFKKFWNDARKSKAKAIGLSPVKVSVLASIVQAEQNRFNDEKAIIAGLYINRIKKGMPLESDPTLIYAKGDFTITRVLNEDKEVDSPYNTYRHTGLPPGPICLPELSSLEAVLNYTKSDYIFMCAKEDFSGRHNFAKTNEEHNRNAQKYRQGLNERNIRR